MPSSGTKSSGLGLVFGAIGAMLGATACFVGCVAVLAALGREHSAPTALLLLVAVGFAAGAILLMRLAMRLEHRFMSSTPPVARARRATPTPARTPQQARVTRIVGTVLAVGAVAGLGALTVSLYSAAQLSSYTQHHGLSRQGVVTRVYTRDHYTRYDSWTTYDYDVALAVPAAGRTSTRLHDPSRDTQNFDVKDAVTVLVDPKQPGYAEVPGRELQSRWWFLGPLFFALLFLGLATLLVYEEIKHRRHVRTARATGAPIAAGAGGR
jgi:hypothetical protein